MKAIVESDGNNAAIEDELKPQVMPLWDSKGKSYQLRLCEMSTSSIMRVFDGPVRVAEANCLNQRPVLFVGNLEVMASARHPIQGFAKFKYYLGLSCEGRCENYRKRGLGSALLNFVVDYARTHQFQAITGELVARDLATNSDLPEWYRRRGFDVRLEPSGRAGKIELVLKNAAADTCSNPRPAD